MILAYIRRCIKNITTDHIFIGGFFIFLVVGLFLGDGKQPLIDTLASVVIISLWIMARYYLQKQRTLPKTLTILWIINLIYFLIRTLFSDSVAYSISSTMRLVMAFLVFSLFYEYAKDMYKQIFIKGLIIFSIFAIVISLFLMIFPNYSVLLPLMNLVYANYGHNYLATILIIVYPIALTEIINKKFKTSNFLYYCLVVLFLILSFSRGAFLLMGMYTIFQLGLTHLKKRRKIVFFVIIVAFLLFGSFIIISSYSNTIKKIQHVSWLQRQVDKPQLLQESRFKYWKQAWEGIKTHPLFGTGPGTFYLISKKYQLRPGEYSWFAHNYVFQELSELGIIGTILFCSLLFTLLYLSTKQKTIFVTSIILILINSLFDFNLDFLIIYLMMFALLGITSY